MDCINFIVELNPDMVASYRETEQLIITTRPFWSTIAFAIAVFCGAIGTLLLMLKKKAALYLYVISLAGTVITIIQVLLSGIAFSAGEITGIIIIPVIVAVFLIWYTKHTQNKGWLS